MATHSGILAWEIPWTEEPGYSPWGRKESDTTERLNHKENRQQIGADGKVNAVFHPYWGSQGGFDWERSDQAQMIENLQTGLLAGSRPQASTW